MFKYWYRVLRCKLRLHSYVYLYTYLEEEPRQPTAKFVRHLFACTICHRLETMYPIYAKD